MHSNKNNFFLIKLAIFVCLIAMTASCKKMIEAKKPVDTITTDETFSTTANATSALMQVYQHLTNGDGSVTFGNGFVTLATGLSSDELNNLMNDPNLLEFQFNSLQVQNSYVFTIWYRAYQAIYYANAVIENVPASTGIADTVKNQLIGEAKFLRALLNFYLVNMFGDIPHITTNDWRKLTLLPRTAKAEIYQAIVSDLEDAQELLPADYSVTPGQRTRANSFAATALLSRVYLYLQEWSKAEEQASVIINATDFFVLPSLQESFSCQ